MNTNYTGVRYVVKKNHNKPWMALFVICRQPVYLGCHDSDLEAARAYDNGVFYAMRDGHSTTNHKLNFPQEYAAEPPPRTNRTDEALLKFPPIPGNVEERMLKARIAELHKLLKRARHALQTLQDSTYFPPSEPPTFG